MTVWNLPEACVFEGRTVRYGISGEGPPLIVVHGTPWSSFNLRHLIEPLSQDFTVYYYDLLGYGQSDKSPGDVSLGIQNRVLDHLIEHWGLEAPSIIGHDFGGTTVLRTHLINGRSFDRIPDSLFHVIQDAGHLVIEEQPHLLVEKILPFLQNESIT